MAESKQRAERVEVPNLDLTEVVRAIFGEGLIDLLLEGELFATLTSEQVAAILGVLNPAPEPDCFEGALGANIAGES